MSDQATIREHEESLLERLAPERRRLARDHLEQNGWFPIAELARDNDPRWTQLVPARRQNAAYVEGVLRAYDAGDRCVLFEDEGKRKSVTSLNDALTWSIEAWRRL